MVLTASFALFPVTGFLATVIPEKLASQELDASIGASEPHDFSVRLQHRSSATPSASTASCPASVTISSRPSVGQDGANMDLIWVGGEGIYFFEQDWTGSISLIRFNKSVFW